MADTRCQLEVEAWVRQVWLAERYNQPFSVRRLQLSPGGYFEFDAVSADGKMVATISTSSARTAGGKRATGAVMKHRSDMLFLLMSGAKHPLLVLTDLTMYNFWQAERKRGRVPDSVEVVYAEIPEELASRLRQARARSSAEMRPEPPLA